MMNQEQINVLDRLETNTRCHVRWTRKSLRLVDVLQDSFGMKQNDFLLPTLVLFVYLLF